MTTGGGGGVITSSRSCLDKSLDVYRIKEECNALLEVASTFHKWRRKALKGMVCKQLGQLLKEMKGEEDGVGHLLFQLDRVRRREKQLLWELECAKVDAASTREENENLDSANTRLTAAAQAADATARAMEERAAAADAHLRRMAASHEAQVRSLTAQQEELRCRVVDVQQCESNLQQQLARSQQKVAELEEQLLAEQQRREAAEARLADALAASERRAEQLEQRAAASESELAAERRTLEETRAQLLERECQLQSRKEALEAVEEPAAAPQPPQQKPGDATLAGGLESVEEGVAATELHGHASSSGEDEGGAEKPAVAQDAAGAAGEQAADKPPAGKAEAALQRRDLQLELDELYAKLAGERKKNSRMRAALSFQQAVRAGNRRSLLGQRSEDGGEAAAEQTAAAGKEPLADQMHAGAWQPPEATKAAGDARPGEGEGEQEPEQPAKLKSALRAAGARSEMLAEQLEMREQEATELSSLLAEAETRIQQLTRHNQELHAQANLLHEQREEARAWAERLDSKADEESRALLQQRNTLWSQLTTVEAQLHKERERAVTFKDKCSDLQQTMSTMVSAKGVDAEDVLVEQLHSRDQQLLSLQLELLEMRMQHPAPCKPGARSSLQKGGELQHADSAPPLAPASDADARMLAAISTQVAGDMPAGFSIAQSAAGSPAASAPAGRSKSEACGPMPDRQALQQQVWARQEKAAALAQPKEQALERQADAWGEARDRFLQGTCARLRGRLVQAEAFWGWRCCTSRQKALTVQQQLEGLEVSVQLGDEAIASSRRALHAFLQAQEGRRQLAAARLALLHWRLRCVRQQQARGAWHDLATAAFRARLGGLPGERSSVAARMVERAAAATVAARMVDARQWKSKKLVFRSWSSLTLLSRMQTQAAYVLQERELQLQRAEALTAPLPLWIARIGDRRRLERGWLALRLNVATAVADRCLQQLQAASRQLQDLQADPSQQHAEAAVAWPVSAQTVDGAWKEAVSSGKWVCGSLDEGVGQAAAQRMRGGQSGGGGLGNASGSAQTAVWRRWAGSSGASMGCTERGGRRELHGQKQEAPPVWKPAGKAPDDSFRNRSLSPSAAPASSARRPPVTRLQDDEVCSEPGRTARQLQLSAAPTTAFCTASLDASHWTSALPSAADALHRGYSSDGDADAFAHETQLLRQPARRCAAGPRTARKRTAAAAPGRRAAPAARALPMPTAVRYRPVPAASGSNARLPSPAAPKQEPIPQPQPTLLGFQRALDLARGRASGGPALPQHRRSAARRQGTSDASHRTVPVGMDLRHLDELAASMQQSQQQLAQHIAAGRGHISASVHPQLLCAHGGSSAEHEVAGAVRAASPARPDGTDFVRGAALQAQVLEGMYDGLGYSLTGLHTSLARGGSLLEPPAPAALAAVREEQHATQH